MMLEETAVDDARGLVSEGDFYHAAHRRIFATIGRLRDQGHTPDALAVREELRRCEQLEDSGGAEYLAEIVDIVPTAANVTYHAGIVLDDARKRRLITAGGKIIGLARNGDSADDVAAEAERLIFAATDRGGSSGARVGDLLDAALEAHERQTENAIALPWADLNSPLGGGLHRQELAIVAARPSIGKSSMLVQAAIQAGRRNVPVFFASLEMGQFLIVRKMLSAASYLPILELRKSAHRTRDEEQALAAGTRALREAPITLETNLHDLGRLTSRIRRFVSRNPGALVVVDYLQLVDGVGENRTQAVGSVGRALKRLATETDCAVFAAAQLNREVEKRVGGPQLSDLRESGDLEADADVVLLLERPAFGKVDSEIADHERRLARVTIGKNRNGPTPVGELDFDGPTGTFGLREKRTP